MRIGALLILVLGRGIAVTGAAVDFQLERHLGGAQLLDHQVDLGERIGHVLGPCRISILPLTFCAHPAGWSWNEPWIAMIPTRGAPVAPNSTPTVPPKQ